MMEISKGMHPICMVTMKMMVLLMMSIAHRNGADVNCQGSGQVPVLDDGGSDDDQDCACQGC